MKKLKNWLKRQLHWIMSPMLWLKNAIFMSSIKKQTRNLSEEEKFSNIYYQASNTPLSVFIDAVCDKRIDSLIIDISKTVNVAMLPEALGLLCYEFSDLCGSGTSRIWKESSKSVLRSKAYIRGLGIAIFLIQTNIKEDIEKAINSLKVFGIETKFPETEQEKKDLIVKIESKITNRKVILMKDQSDYDKVEKSSPKSELPTRKYFTEIMIELRSFMGYNVREQDTTLMEFSIMLNKYNNHKKAQNG